MEKIGKCTEEPVGSTYSAQDLLLQSAAHDIDAAAQRSMEVMGYVVVARDGMIVRQLRDGSYVELERLAQRSGPCRLD
jgi:hypothetical protein